MLLYRCRLCGVVYEGQSWPDGNIGTVSAELRRRQNVGHWHHMTIGHGCADGVLGEGDFVGVARPDAAVPGGADVR